MGILIDTSILIQHERGTLDVARVLNGLDDGEAFLSAITASEMLHGVYRARDPGQRARRLASVEAVLTAFPLIPVDGVVARVHAHLWAQLAAAGTVIGPHDLWIAATCMADGHGIVTANAREFARVPGLVVHGPN